MTLVDYSAYGPDGQFLAELASDAPDSAAMRESLIRFLGEQVTAGTYPRGSWLTTKPATRPIVSREHAKRARDKVIHGAGRPPCPGMTVRDLFNDLAQLMNMDAGDDLVFVESHGLSSPLLYTEPGDGLEHLHLIGTELDTPATPRIYRRRARARYLLHNEPRRPDPSR
jgi:hypothetical protein